MSEEKRVTSIVRVQLSIAVKHNPDIDVEEVIKNAEFEASYKDTLFISVRQINYSNSLNRNKH